MKYPEITCPYCRIGFGGLKAQTKDGQTTFHHIDICWAPEEGLSVDCQQPELIAQNLVSIDENQNPKFTPEFKAKLEELRNDFEDNPVDISKENFDFDQFSIAFIECMNWGLVDLKDEDYDRESISKEKVKELYDSGKNLKECLRTFIIPTV